MTQNLTNLLTNLLTNEPRSLLILDNDSESY